MVRLWSLEGGYCRLLVRLNRGVCFFSCQIRINWCCSEGGECGVYCSLCEYSVSYILSFQDSDMCSRSDILGKYMVGLMLIA